MGNKKAKIAGISEIKAAIGKRSVEADDTVIATSVQYSPKFDIYILGLGNGTRTILQRERLQGLQDASPAQLKRVELMGRGTGLHWPDLDVDLYVPALVRGVYGSKEWMKEVGRRGGIVKSSVKAQAARENGKKGGRPRTYTRVPHGPGVISASAKVAAAVKTVTGRTREHQEEASGSSKSARERERRNGGHPKSQPAG